MQQPRRPAQGPTPAQAPAPLPSKLTRGSLAAAEQRAAVQDAREACQALLGVAEAQLDRDEALETLAALQARSRANG
jgi:hypothetical protein